MSLRRSRSNQRSRTSNKSNRSDRSGRRGGRSPRGNKEKRYYNIDLNALAYLDNAREVERKDGSGTFLALDLAVMQGDEDKVEYLYFDAIVAVDAAAEIVDEYIDDITDEDVKVMAKIRFSGLHEDTYKSKNGRNAGKHVIGRETNLLAIEWMKIKGPDDEEYEYVIEPETERNDRRRRAA